MSQPLKACVVEILTCHLIRSYRTEKKTDSRSATYDYMTGPSQSGQAIKLFQIIRYVSDFQTLNNPGFLAACTASKN